MTVPHRAYCARDNNIRVNKLKRSISVRVKIKTNETRLNNGVQIDIEDR